MTTVESVYNVPCSEPTAVRTPVAVVANCARSAADAQLLSEFWTRIDHAEIVMPLLNTLAQPFLRGDFAVAALILAWLPARADFPLRAERALYEEVGEAEIAVWVERDRRRPRRSVHAQVGAVVAEGIEIELSLGRLSERDDAAEAAVACRVQVPERAGLLPWRDGGQRCIRRRGAGRVARRFRLSAP